MPLRHISVPMNVPIVLNAPNKEGSYVRIVEEIYSNDQNEQKPNAHHVLSYSTYETENVQFASSGLSAEKWITHEICHQYN